MIEIKTKYTYENYKGFIQFSSFRGKYYRLTRAVLNIVMILVLVIWIIIYCFFRLEYERDMYFYVLMICMIFYLVFQIFIPGILTRSIMKKAPAVFQSGIDFVFEDAGVTVVQTGDSIRGTSELLYSTFFKVYEVKKAFYIFFTPQQAFVVPKEDFSVGSPDDLRRLLQAKLDKKFILCK